MGQSTINGGLYRFIVYSWDNHRTKFGWIFLHTALSEGTESMLNYELPYILLGVLMILTYTHVKTKAGLTYRFKDPWLEENRCTLVFKTILNTC